MRGGAADGEGGSRDADAEGQVPLSAPDAAAPARRKEPAAPPATDAGRKRAAVELAARHGHHLRQTAQRYSLCAEDAEDAYQRTLEILLVKAPTDRPRELLGWSRTVVKHEALAIRHHRERMLGTAPPRGGDGEAGDRIAQIPARGGGPEERLEQSERVARSREALRLLKPAQLKALTLLAEGYSYAEIGEITGFSQTKVNRCLAEGREHFRRQFTRSEDGSRCAEMSPLLSAFCDGQTSPEQSAEMREHLRACAGCRAALRAYRAAPGAIAALAPALPVWRALLERGQEMVAGLQARLPGGGGAADATLAQVAAAGGARGGGMAALAKLLAICAGTAGSAACVATGVAPVPFDLTPERAEAPRIERVAERAYEPPVAVEPEPAAAEPAPPEPEPPEAPSPAPEAAPSAEAGAVEYAPPPPPPPAPAPSGDPAGPGSGSAAGEFGP